MPEPIAKADFLINLPKFKAHPWCRLTLSLKNFIGIQNDRHRLVDHNLFLEHKIADLREVIQPKFIAIDAIIAGQKMMLTPTPFPMGAIVMGTNSCAVDTVGCHMVHVNPKDVIHLRYATERGLGPMNLEEIEILGNFPLKEVQEKTRNVQFCMEHIDSYFGAESNLSCTVGTFPETHSPDYCWGGCPGALQEAVPASVLSCSPCQCIKKTSAETWHVFRQTVRSDSIPLSESVGTERASLATHADPLRIALSVNS